MIGLGCAVLGVLGMIFLDHVVAGIAHTVLASTVIVVLLTGALVLHHAGHQIAHVCKPPRSAKARGSKT